MGQLTKGNAPTITVGGRVFSDLKNLIVIRTRVGVGGNLYGTARSLNASSGYQVPAGKTLRITAVREVGSTLNQAVSIGHGDDDKGMNSAAAPTNAVWQIGDKDGVLGKNTNQYGVTEFVTNFTIPTGKYPCAYTDSTGGAIVEMWGYLE